MRDGADSEAIPDSVLQAVREGYQDRVEERGVLPTGEADHPRSEGTA